MPRPRRAALLLALSLVFGCGKGAQPTPNGLEVATWRLKDDTTARTGDHKQRVDLGDGVQVDLAFDVGTVSLEGADLRAPLALRVQVVESAGRRIDVVVPDFPAHYHGMPADERALDVRVHAVQDTSGCMSTGSQTVVTILRVRPDGSVTKVVPDLAAPVDAAKPPS